MNYVVLVYGCLKLKVNKFHHLTALPFSRSTYFLHFCIYILHTRPDPITKRFSAVPPYKWRDANYICLPIYLLKFSSFSAEERRVDAQSASGLKS